jgi:hypothetical protein
MGLWIDDRLRRLNHICEFSNDPRCVFRMQIDEARLDVVLADGACVRNGDKVINLHLLNEHIPAIPPEGPNFAWARRMGVAMDFSLRQLAAFTARHPEFDGVKAIRANLAVSTARTTAQMQRVMQHFGFEFVPDEEEVSWRQRLHLWGENMLGLLLVMAVNPAAARISVLSRVRLQMLLSRQSFEQRFRTPRRFNCKPEGQRHGEVISASERLNAGPVRISAASRA